MSPELLFELAWKSLVLAGATLVLLRLMKRRSAAERSWLADSGLVAMLLLPVAVLAGPEWQVQTLDPVTPVFAASGPIALSEGSAASATGGPTPLSTLSGPVSLTAQELLGLAYVIPAGLLILLLLLAVLRLQWLRDRAEVVVHHRWALALASAQRRLGFKHGTALLVSAELRSPISWGVIRPIIILDPRAANDEARAEAIIAHELAHVARLDWAMLLVGRVATALFWFNPVVWLLARRCYEIREEAVDDAVLCSHICSTEYAELLIEAARYDNRAVLLPANGVMGAGLLTDRVERVLDPFSSRVPAQTRWKLACGASTLMLAAPLSALSPVQEPGPSAATPGSSLDFTALELRGRGKVTLLHGLVPRVRFVTAGGSQPDITVRDGELVIDGCTRSCSGGQPDIEIVTPRLEQVTVEGGGAVQSKGSFPGQPSMVAAIRGGGLIRISGIEAGRVTATISGGGTIKTHVRDALDAAIRGDGSVVYWGNPEVKSSVAGGGVIVRADD